MRKILLSFLALLPLLAQAQVSTYTFSSTTRPYTPIIGTVLGTAGLDDDPFNGLPIGFAFTYNGIAHTTFSVNSNGVVALGPTINDNAGGAYFVDGNVHSGRAISSPNAPNDAISGFNIDLVSTDTGSLSYATIGTAPNRVLVVQWSGFQEFHVMDDEINFQVRLLEGSNRIEVAYGSFTSGSADPGFGAQVGLRGASPDDFNIRATNTNWSASTAGTANTDSLVFSESVVPASGLVYAWDAVRPSSDVSANAVTLPAGTGCALPASTTISLNVTNQGTTPVTVISAGYSLDGGTPVEQTFNLPSPLASGTSTTLTFTTPIATPSAGSYQIVATASARGETSATTNNDTVRQTLISRTSITPTVPYEEGFVSTTDLPDNWTTEAFNGSGDWAATGPDVYHGSTTTSSIQTQVGAGAAFFNSYSSAFADARLSTPCMNLSGVTSDSLVLEVSYLQSGEYLTYNENITVEVSTDAGATYQPLAVLARPNPDLGTDEGQWALAHVSLTPYKGLSSVMLGFHAIGTNGDNQAIDFIRLLPNTPVAARPRLATASLVAYPNPTTTGHISLRGLPASMLGKPAMLSDVSGRIVATHLLARDMNLGNLPVGLYYLTAAGLQTKVSIAK